MTTKQKVAKFISFALFLAGAMLVALAVANRSAYAYHAFVACAVLSILADVVAFWAGNKMPQATRGQKAIVLGVQALVWVVALAGAYWVGLFEFANR